MATTRMQIMKLQNGSDIRGVACEGIYGEPVTLSSEAAYLIGRAFAIWLTKKHSLSPKDCRIGIGTDSRITGPDIKKFAISGMLAEGVYVSDCGMASTPAMFMSIVYPETNYNGSCMITASHLPFNRNGFKFFDADGGLNKNDITDILEIAADIAIKTRRDDVLPDIPTDRLSNFDLISLYSDNLCVKIRNGLNADKYDKPLKGLKIIVDACNGAGGFFVYNILNKLGAETSGSCLLKPDGHFPHHTPNPENNDAIKALRDNTLNAGADLGLIFDPDVDRMSAVLSDGTLLNRDLIIAMMAAILAPEYPGSTIITDSVTSDHLTDFLEHELGLKHLRYMRGYKNVINKCRELNESGIISPLAMETSGHGCMKENYYLDDGAYLAVRLIIALADAKHKGKDLKHLITNMYTDFSAREIRFPIFAKDFKTYGQEILEEFKKRSENSGYDLPLSYEGVRIRFDNDPSGWMLLRASLHDPVIVLNLEGRTKQDLAAITDIARDLLKGFNKLNTSSI